MAEENVSILRVDTGEAVKSVNDLRENIKLLKGNLGDLTIGTQEYQDTLEELTINQNALKNAMHATSASLEDVVAAASSANVAFDEQNKLINQGAVSYNELVHTMAALKEEWRSTTDAAKRSELGEKIKEINDQLKGMDASVGNFSRNVGNYESGFAGIAAKFDAWGETLKNMPPTLGAAKESLGKVGETMQLVGKQPILGIIGLLAPIIIKITEALKDNETAMDAVKRLMESLQPVFDVLQNILEGIAKAFSSVIDWVIRFVAEAEPIKKVASVFTGIGNAILQYLLIPIKQAVAGFKGLANIIKDVFTGNFSDVKKHAKEAGEGIAEAWKEGFSFKTNFQEGQKKGADFIEGVKAKANASAAKEAGEKIGEEITKGVEDKLKLLDVDKALKEGESKRMAAIEKRMKEQAEIDAMVEESWEETNAEIDAWFEEEEKRRQEDVEATKRAEEEKAKARIATLEALASNTSNIMSSLADMMESDEKNSEKNAKKIKALRIASATIDMLQGAVGAFTQASSTYPPPYGQIIGASSAAAVIAMGMANINKIKSTNPGSEGAISAPAAVSPPSIETSMPSVRNVTSASEEDRLNRMAAPQKVYILQSDIEAAGSQSKAQVEESSF